MKHTFLQVQYLFFLCFLIFSGTHAMQPDANFIGGVPIPKTYATWFKKPIGIQMPQPTLAQINTRKREALRAKMTPEQQETLDNELRMTCQDLRWKHYNQNGLRRVDPEWENSLYNRLWLYVDHLACIIEYRDRYGTEFEKKIESLLQRGANPNVKEKSGTKQYGKIYTSYGGEDCLYRLRFKQAMRGYCHESSPLWRRYFLNKRNIPLLHTFINYGAHINHIEPVTGRTPVQTAQSRTVIQFLTHARADLNIGAPINNIVVHTTDNAKTAPVA